jgi:energy-coupling factor transporter transmembrane protein EcfT
MQWRIRPNTIRENTLLGIASLVVVVFFSWVFTWFFPIYFAVVSLLLSLWIRRSGGKWLGHSWGSILISCMLSSLVVVYTLAYAPLKDYRPYAVGSNLYKNMHDGVNAQIENTFVYKNIHTGKTKVMTQNDYNTSKIWENKDWKFDTILPKTIVEGKLPSITEQFNPYISINSLSASDKNNPLVQSELEKLKAKFIVMTSKTYGISDTIPLSDFRAEEYDTSFVKTEIEQIDPNVSEIYALDYILHAPYLFILSSTAIEDADWSSINQLKSIAAKANQKNIPFIIICGSGDVAIQQFKRKYLWDGIIFSNDRTELKAISRSNPGLLLIKDGTVVGKYPHRAIPLFETIIKNHPLK